MFPTPDKKRCKKLCFFLLGVEFNVNWSIVCFIMSFEQTRLELTEFVRLGFEKGSIDLLKKKYDSLKTMDSDKRATLDQVFRDLLLALLSSPQAEVSTWQQFVTYCILACRHDLCTPTMPVVLLGDIFDALTLDKCEQLFRFVEDNVAVWKEELFFSACKNNLLRMCNDLLRRLSRSQNTVFCGRILLFLAKFFPFSERSGLNIVSEFNLDNVTEYGGEGGRDVDVLGDKDDAMEEGTKPETKMKLDYNLYCKFWALQDFFRNPNQCYNKMEWKTFSSHASSVLLAFKSFKLEHLQLKHSLPVAEVGKQHYFAKFLTSQKLLELQLSDANFRRYVLLQFLILFQYLHSPVKFKSESCELKVDQLDWVKETTGLVYSLMAETPPNGPQFVNTVRQILQREEQWNAWKNEGCPEFQRPVQQPGVDDTAGEEMGDRRRAMNRPRRSKRRLGDLVMEADSQNNVLMGNPELTKLWNLSVSNLDACKSKERDFLPSLESYFEEAMEQADPSAMVDDQYKKINDGNFGWRALRLLARRSPHFFTHSNNPINKLPDYLEMMIKRIMKDRPVALLERERGTDEERARNMLQVWAGADEDASPDNLAYTLEGLGLPEAAATLKAASP
ncbi:THO complex subunit 1 isoform X2 [Bacillus rossius redtenbacheri]|uniref:THO complex subunit 1 isoform X2 n=1 Tax=Bacillus rossius redtenbacheri TaxID=93214 RepID=UPI002FDE5738